MTWEDINEPGSHVERGGGDLYWIPKDALVQSSSPMIAKDSQGVSRLVRLSRDPFMATQEARLRCALHDIQPDS